MNAIARWWHLLDAWWFRVSYLRFHPYHGCMLPLAFLYRQLNADIRDALLTIIPEMDWFRSMPTSAIAARGQENRIPLVIWGRSGL